MYNQDFVLNNLQWLTCHKANKMAIATEVHI